MKLLCLESRDVIQERYNRKQRVITLWLLLALAVLLVALYWEVRR